MVTASKVANILKLDKGWRLVVNVGKHGLNSIKHLHLHILGGVRLSWPPGTPGPGGEG